MKTLYVRVTDPVWFVGRELGKMSNAWNNESQELDLTTFLVREKELFKVFMARYAVVVIDSGQLQGNYGQTVTLWEQRKDERQFPYPDFNNLSTRIQLPDHFFGPCSLLGDLQVDRAVCFSFRQKGELVDGWREEKFFIQYSGGYKPETFSELIKILNIVRYFSEICHKLNSFWVTFLNDGVYVKLRAQTNNSNKLSFCMAD